MMTISVPHEGLYQPLVKPVEAVYFDGSKESGEKVIAWLRKRGAAAGYIEKLLPGEVSRVDADLPTGFDSMVVFLYNRKGYTAAPSQNLITSGTWVVRKDRESNFETWDHDYFGDMHEYKGEN